VKKTILAILLALALVLIPAGSAFAINTADVTVTATPGKISITVFPITKDFGPVAADDVIEGALDEFTVTNKCSVDTNNTVSVTTATWGGGATWAHSDTCEPAVDTAGLKAHLNAGAWGDAGDVIVKNVGPGTLAAGVVKKTDWKFGLKLYAPTEVSDEILKSIIVRITAASV